jgi:hypothetical protein
MKLTQYLQSLTKEQKLAFCERLRALRPDKPLRIPVAYLVLLEREDRIPAPNNCWMYVAASDGAVTLHDLRPNLWPADSQAA